MDSPSNHYNVFHRLPHTNDVKPQCPEKYPTMESQGPKNRFIVFNANKSIDRIFEYNIIPEHKKQNVSKIFQKERMKSESGHNSMFHDNFTHPLNGITAE